MKKINKYKLLASICAMSLLVSCDYENINTDRQGMTDEEGIRDGFAVGGSVTSMQKTVFPVGTQADDTDIINLYQTAYHLSGDCWSGFFGQNNDWGGNSHPTYYLLDAMISSTYTSAYTNVLVPWKKLKASAEKNNTPEVFALAQILKISAWHKALESFGPIPYSHAADATMNIPFDSEKDVYTAMFQDLTEAIDVLTLKAEGGVVLMEDFDAVYAGDTRKWDANMSILNHGSNYLTKDNQSHMYIEFHRGFEKICQRIRAKYPDLTIQACASGGGRANYGILPYFDEFWVSDNTDALQRVYMQWGTSYFFPAIAMASHISAAPNHQTFRTIPLKYRIDVAMSGRLGMEIQPKNMTEEEKALCKNAIAEYKTIRPVVQLGDIYRLMSPYDKLGVASMMYVTPEKDKSVFYWWKTEHFVNQHLPRVKMAGLSPDKLYKVHELNRIDNDPLSFEGKTFSGAYLMANGLEIPYNHKVDYHKQNDYSSRVLYLEEVK